MVVSTSCNKTTSLESLRQAELAALNQYVTNNGLSDKLDATGIYYEDLVVGTGDTIKSGYKVMLYFTVSLLNGTVIFTTDDGYGHNYEEQAFYVDASSYGSDANSYLQQIKGLNFGLKKMRAGGSAFMVIPSEYAFQAVDNSNTIGVPRFSTLLVNVKIRRAFSPAQLSQ
jgi:FKBP-type peptidyl-prolyl cis-trans isomerase